MSKDSRHSVDRADQALSRLEALVHGSDDASEERRDAAIMRFLFSYEQVWKAVKELLDKEGYDLASPRSVLKQAYQLGWLENEDLWLGMIRDRNITSHTYNEQHAQQAFERIKSYAPAMRAAIQLLRTKL